MQTILDWKPFSTAPKDRPVITENGTFVVWTKDYAPFSNRVLREYWSECSPDGSINQVYTYQGDEYEHELADSDLPQYWADFKFGN